MTQFSECIVLSDSHGFYDTTIKMLAAEGLTEPDGKWIAPASVQLVHLGDTVDRGPDSVKMFNYFRDLQRDLGPERVVRLMGNHEFHYCGGPRFGQSRVDTAAVSPLAPAMIADASEGLLEFAHSLTIGSDDWLLVHGGLDPRHPVPDGVQDTPSSWARYLNETGRLMYSDDTLPEGWRERLALLTGISGVRGGYDSLSGVTWCDLVEELIPQADRLSFGQIVGHRPNDEVYFHPDGKLVGVNVYYGLAQLLRVDLVSGKMTTSALHGDEWGS